ncbi:cysteine proteinase, partial [Exidia glandulosa HHB12029]
MATPSPWVCLQCQLSACWTGSASHIVAHLRETGHGFAVQAKTGALWCTKCETVVLSRRLTSERAAVVHKEEEARTYFQGDGKKGREAYTPWKPDAKDAGLLRGITTVPCRAHRGILNLGNTCYLNCILQTFLHNPLLRNYFLADKHNSKACERAPPCISCELDKLFSEVYSTTTNGPFAPTSLLHATWTIGKDVNLSGYAQHDAHEAFMTLLNALHAHTRGSTSSA